MQEAMRMYPVTADGTNRIATKDLRLGRFMVPKGTMVWIPFSAMFNSPHNFPQPDSYIPVRRLIAHNPLVSSLCLPLPSFSLSGSDLAAQKLQWCWYRCLAQLAYQGIGWWLDEA